MLDEDFVSKLLAAFGKIKGEIDEKGGEFDFRYALVDYLFRDVFGWTRKAGEGHLKIERERKDILFYDDSDPPLPVLIVETVNPNEESASHIGKLKGYLGEMGRVRHGILTNGHDFSVYEYERNKKGEKINKRLELDIDEIVHKGVANLTEEEKRGIIQLRIFVKDRFVSFNDIEYFTTYRNDIPLNYKRGYDFFIEGLRKSLEELNGVFTQFFGIYIKRSHISGERLREAFENWNKTRAGGETEPKETFCKETAYILLNRMLFARICEDNGFMQKRISGKFLANFIEMHKGVKMPYLKALEDAFDLAEGEYERIYRVGIFDWWRMERAEKYTLGEDEKRVQGNLEEELDYVIGNVLKRFNHFDFKTVDSDILGHVYEDYLPKEERKKLGEYYTPLEVVRYILDAVGYTSGEEIDGKRILDPSCGSGTFLVEALRRVIQRFLAKFHKSSVHKLEPEEASMILESVRANIYGLDINIFACHIAEMNLFFQTIDLYGAVKSKYKEEVFKGFNVFHTDSLMPPGSKLEDYSDVRVKPFLNNIKDIAKIKGMKFDFVVGNPPYVRVDNISRDLRTMYKSVYNWLLIGKWDIYIPFIYKGIEWLNRGDTFGYIVSNKFFLLESGLQLRKYILENCTIERITDVCGVSVFAGSLPAATIIIVKKEKPLENHKIRVSILKNTDIPKELEEETKQLKKLTKLEKILKYLLKSSRSYNVTQNKFKKDSDLLFIVTIPDQLIPLIGKIEKECESFGEICNSNISEGDTIRDEEKYVISREEYEKLPENEKKNYRKVIKGENIKRYNTIWSGNYIKCLKEVSKPKLLIKDYSKRMRVAYDKGEYKCLRTIYCASLLSPT